MFSDIKDRFLRLRIERDEKEIKIGFTATALVITALLANVAYLNFFIINGISSKSYAPISVIASPTPLPSALPSTPSATPLVTPLVTPLATPYVPIIPIQTPQATVKDYYLNFGSGTNQSTDWTDISGTLYTYDLGQYQNVKTITLETTTNVPTANGSVSVRLFNKTGNYAVWNSDRTVQAQASGDLLISQNLIYDLGPKMYQIQMKSQFGVPANLIQARLHIIAQ